MTRWNIDHEHKTVTNSFLTSYSKAIYRDGLGCTLVGKVSEESLRNQYLPSIDTVDLDPEQPWPKGTAGMTELAGFNYQKFNPSVDYHFTEHEDFQIKTSSVLVAYQGKLIYERYAPEYNKDSNLQVYSVAKTIASLLTGTLVDSQKISLNNSADTSYWTSADEKSAITYDHLLTMSSGLEFNETYGDKESDIIKIIGEDDMGAYAANKALSSSPGSTWHYSSGNTLILSDAIKNSLGGDLSDIYGHLHSELFRKIDINSAIVQADNSGNLSLGFQAFMTPRDMTRLGQLLAQKGMWNGEHIISPDWWQYMNRPVNLPVSYGIDYGASIYLNTAHQGNQQWPGLPEDTVTAIGYGGQFIVAIPSMDLVFVRTGLTNDFLSIMPEIHYLLSELIASLPANPA